MTSTVHSDPQIAQRLQVALAEFLAQSGSTPQGAVQGAVIAVDVGSTAALVDLKARLDGALAGHPTDDGFVAGEGGASPARSLFTDAEMTDIRRSSLHTLLGRIFGSDSEETVIVHYGARGVPEEKVAEVLERASAIIAARVRLANLEADAPLLKRSYDGADTAHTQAQATRDAARRALSERLPGVPEDQWPQAKERWRLRGPSLDDLRTDLATARTGVATALEARTTTWSAYSGNTEEQRTLSSQLTSDTSHLSWELRLPAEARQQQDNRIARRDKLDAQMPAIVSLLENGTAPDIVDAARQVGFPSANDVHASWSENLLQLTALACQAHQADPEGNRYEALFKALAHAWDYQLTRSPAAERTVVDTNVQLLFTGNEPPSLSSGKPAPINVMQSPASHALAEKILTSYVERAKQDGDAWGLTPLLRALFVHNTQSLSAATLDEGFRFRPECLKQVEVSPGGLGRLDTELRKLCMSESPRDLLVALVKNCRPLNFGGSPVESELKLRPDMRGFHQEAALLEAIRAQLTAPEIETFVAQRYGPTAPTDPTQLRENILSASGASRRAAPGTYVSAEEICDATGKLDQSKLMSVVAHVRAPETIFVVTARDHATRQAELQTIVRSRPGGADRLQALEIDRLRGEILPLWLGQHPEAHGFRADRAFAQGHFVA